MTEHRTDYDAIAGGYDRRYAFQQYHGIADAVTAFLGEQRLGAVLEAGCGTGHWLPLIAARTARAVGLDLSANMLGRARAAAPQALLVRARAEQQPWRDGVFDRIVCINALHHFAREPFFAEARRLLKPGGGLITIGLDPHTTRDQWWVYEYFPETLAIDRERFAPVRIIRGELARAGFAWAESFEAHHIESQRTVADAFPDGLDRRFTSQLTLVPDDVYAAGLERLQTAGPDAWLVADLRFYATVGWLAP